MQQINTDPSGAFGKHFLITGSAENVKYKQFDNSDELNLV
jgi:hypothetical protein